MSARASAPKLARVPPLGIGHRGPRLRKVLRRRCNPTQARHLGAHMCGNLFDASSGHTHMANAFYRARFVWDHRWTQGRMSAYVDKELGSRGRARLERHVWECEECRLMLAELSEMLDALRRLPA